MVVNIFEDHRLWHGRLGHMNRKNMAILAGNPNTGISLSNTNEDPCNVCIRGKQHRQPFKLSKTRTKDQLELIHSDLCGPMETMSISGSGYFLTFVDDYTKKVFVYFLQHKNQAAKTFETFKAFVEKQTEKTIKCLRSDRGKEYVNEEFKNILQKASVIN